MTKTLISDVVTHLDNVLHPELQEEYDNAGYLLGDDSRPYTGALVALDLTENVVDEALDHGLNFIVTHHPFIFNGLKRLTTRSEAGRLVQRLIKNDLSVYAAHTNLDNLAWGVNGALAEQLGLRNCRILRVEHTDSTLEAGAGMVGELPEAEAVDSFLLRLKQLLGISILRTSAHDPRRPIRRVALCGGSGSFLIGDAIAAGADLFITADLKYHDFQRTDGRMVLCDAGHYESEQFAKDVIFRVISEKFSTFACRISATQKSLIQYI